MCRLSWNLGAPNSWSPQGLSRPVTGIVLPSSCTKFLVHCSHTYHYLYHHHHRRHHHHHHHFNTLRYKLPRLIGYVWDWCCITWHAFTSSKCQYSLETKSVAYQRVTGAEFLAKNGWKRQTSNYHLVPVCSFTTRMSLKVFAAAGLHKLSCSDSSRFRETALIGIT